VSFSDERLPHRNVTAPIDLEKDPTLHDWGDGKRRFVIRQDDVRLDLPVWILTGSRSQDTDTDEEEEDTGEIWFYQVCITYFGNTRPFNLLRAIILQDMPGRHFGGRNTVSFDI
jgi:hypothetical protein